MTWIYDLLNSSPLLAVFITVGLGTLVGAIKFGPVRFGSAGALFVGLALGALDPRLGENLELIQSLGLALFVYTVGLSAGATFFRDLRRQLPIMVLSVVVLTLTAGLAVGLGKLLGMDMALIGGTFAGGLTSTPTLAAATQATGSSLPAVGYSLGYPVGVLVAILVVSLIVNKQWPGRNDPPPAASRGLDAASVEVSQPTKLTRVPGFAEQKVRLSYLNREGRMRVVTPDEELQRGDRVVVVGPKEDLSKAIAHLGVRLDHHLADDRSEVENQRFVVSSRFIAGLSVAELDMPGKFGGVVTRVRRGDLDLLASDDLTLEYGDRVLAVVPRESLGAVRKYFGDSERKISEVDAVTLGAGMALGLLLGLISLPLPGGISFALGAAAGPLVIGMVLGKMERTGPVIWGMPLAANLTTRQLGLLFFLAAVGLASGQEFASKAFSAAGLLVVLVAAVLALFACALLALGAKKLGYSAPRTSGVLAGLLGQPAVLSYAASRVTDERVEAGYAALFALGIIVKILLVQIVVLF